MGLKYETFDVYEHRGQKLRAKLESYLEKGNIHTIMYSNPNNPSWICFTEEELQIIGEMANKYDVFVFEDLAYFGMDFRQDISKPGVPPFQPSVGKYTDNYALLISGSKAFSYAGERIALMIMSNKLFNLEFDDLMPYFKMKKLGRAIIYGTVYAISSGVAHSAQYAMAAILKACNDGTYNYLNDVKEYGEKAAIMKKLFTDNGFVIVYDKDGDKDLADGFYFTVAYPGMSSDELLHEFLYYGISAISLVTCGSERTDHFHTASHDGRGDITSALDVIECLHHTDHSTQESQGRSDGDEQADPGKVGFEFGHLNATVGNHRFFNRLKTFVITVETLIEHSGERAFGVAADIFCLLNTTILESILNLG